LESEPADSHDSTAPAPADEPAEAVPTRETIPVWAQKPGDSRGGHEPVAPVASKGDPDWSKPEAPTNGETEPPQWAATVPTDPGEPIEAAAAEASEPGPEPASAPVTEPPRAVAADAMKSTWPPAAEAAPAPPEETDVWPPEPPTEHAMPAWPHPSELKEEPSTPAQPIPSWPESFEAAEPAEASPAEPAEASAAEPAASPSEPAVAKTEPPAARAAEPAEPAEPAPAGEAGDAEPAGQPEPEAAVAAGPQPEAAEAKVPPTITPAARKDTADTVKPSVPPEEEWNPEPPPPLPAAAPEAESTPGSGAPTATMPAAAEEVAAPAAADEPGEPGAPAEPAIARPSWAPQPSAEPAAGAGQPAAAASSAYEIPAWAPRVPLAAEPGTPTWFSPREQIPHATSQPAAHAEPAHAQPAPMPVVGGQLPVAPVPKPQPQPEPPESARSKAAWEVVPSPKTERANAPQGPTAEDRSYAEWFAWAKRGGAPASACHAAAQGAFKALAAGKDLATAVQWATGAMSRPPENVSYTRQTYCAWFSLASIDLSLDQNRSHAFANAALQALDAGQDAGAAHAAGLAAAGIR
jgi:nicotinate-nucleotide--dimethylbenzimidazole phosphoribosyltransferase